MGVSAALSTLVAISLSAQASGKVDGAELLRHIQVLASDEFEGRSPGTPGEEKAVLYVTEEFRRVGLSPGNPDGTYVQRVPLTGFTTKARGILKREDETVELQTPKDWVAVSRRMTPSVEVKDSELLFVGYGVVAPEYNWDDFKDVDTRGKTLVMLVGDPPVPDPADPSRLDEKTFKGRAMTYYGRWTYKYEIAAEKGAAAVLLVHETAPAGYPYQVVVGSWGRENFDIPAADRNAGRPAVEAWITVDRAKALFASSGLDFETLKRSAADRDFRPVVLPVKADFTVENTLREVASKNVVGLLPGGAPEARGEYVIYTAHWDHLGRDPSLKGDQIYNGAADNASGTASLIEIARAFRTSPIQQRRSILFLAVTAEEKGLLGAKYYATHPLYPLDRTLADFNIDVINTWGRTRDFTNVGLGQSDLDNVLADVLATRGRVMTGDAEPEKGLFFRSDHFEFAKQGVPSLYYNKGGLQFLDKPEGYGLRKRDAYTRDDYHKVTDEVKSDWDLSGAVDDLNVFVEVGRRVANGAEYPAWKPGSEFRAKREAMKKP